MSYRNQRCTDPCRASHGRTGTNCWSVSALSGVEGRGDTGGVRVKFMASIVMLGGDIGSGDSLGVGTQMILNTASGSVLWGRMSQGLTSAHCGASGSVGEGSASLWLISAGIARGGGFFSKRLRNCDLRFWNQFYVTEIKKHNE